MTQLTLGSLASGIGGLDLAVETIFDAVPIWHAEFNKAAAATYSKHWDTPNLWDITKIDWSTLERPDIICGGYPCQPFSLAGKRKGEDDPRNLWPYFATAIRTLRPRFVVLENVAAHLSLGFGRVLGDLAAAGYDAEWGVFRASQVGATHRRERIFIVAYPIGGGYTGDSFDKQRRIQPTSSFKATPNWSQGCSRDSNKGADQQTTDARTHQFDFRHYAPAVRRWELVMTEEVPCPAIGRHMNPSFVRWMMGYPPEWTSGSKAQQLRMLGNAVVPQQGEFAIRHLLARVNLREE